MSPQIIFQSTGVEELLETVEIVILRDINDALATVYERWRERDEARAARRQVPYVEMTYDNVPADHFHIGNFPEPVLEETPKSAYPFIVLTVEDYAADAEDPRNDHVDVFRDNLVVHALAKASDSEGSEVVFRRAVRMSMAIHLCLGSARETASLLKGFSNPVRGQNSMPWTYKDKGRKLNWWYQAVGTSYAIKTYSSQYQ